MWKARILTAAFICTNTTALLIISVLSFINCGDSLLENSEGFSNFVEQAITETVSRILGTIDPVVIAKQLKEIFGLEINKNDLQELNASMGFRETFNELLNPFLRQ